MSTRIRHILGCMSGTSLDAIDLALVKITGTGLAMKAEFVRGASYASRPLSRLMRPLTTGKRHDAREYAKLANMLGMTIAVEIKRFMEDGDEPIDLISVHGQTIYHDPPLTWQLLNPWTISEMSQRPVIYDLRGADIATGGEGAPITPLADHLLFRHPTETRIVLNLGGFVNFTWLPSSSRQGTEALESIRGGDVCACNHLLDYIARKFFKKRYDKDGVRALQGEVNETAYDFIFMVMDATASIHRSLGDTVEPINAIRTMQHECSAPDLARTACAAIAEVVRRHIGDADRVIIAGGGAKNLALMNELLDRLPMPLQASDELGIPMQYREAVAMGILGAMCADRVPITLPQITGCITPAPVAGSWVFPSNVDPVRIFQHD